jgi:predicted dehydrogenase
MSKTISGVVRVGLIGAGGISGEHVKGFIRHGAKVRCVAMADVSQENLKKRADQLTAGGAPSPRTFGDWKAMLSEMSGELDAVDICLPHHLHGPAILDSAAAGKHILCEKPMCTSLTDADAIAAAVSKAGVTYMSAHNQLFMPVVQEAKKLIDAGAIGKVWWLRSQDCFRGNPDRARWGWRADLKTQGGGELIDTGYHPSYRLLYLAGSEVQRIHGAMGRYLLGIDGEDTASVQVRFASGAIGEILTSWAFANPHGTHQVHVIGETGQIFGSGDTLYHLPQGYSEPAKRTFPSVNTFEAEIEHFADCLREGRRPIHAVEEGRAVLELILQAAKSAEGWQRR